VAPGLGALERRVHVRHFYGLMTVKGRFDRYHGSLDLSARPAVELTIDADSLNTKVKKRDEHLPPRPPGGSAMKTVSGNELGTSPRFATPDRPHAWRQVGARTSVNPVDDGRRNR
jgi:hypothetical protein